MLAEYAALVQPVAHLVDAPLEIGLRLACRVAQRELATGEQVRQAT